MRTFSSSLRLEMGRSINSSDPKVCTKFLVFFFFQLMSSVSKTYQSVRSEHIYGGEQNADRSLTKHHVAEMIKY